MKISAKTVYGLQALLEIAAHPAMDELKTTEIASAQKIPAKFLEQIMVALKKAGLVKSLRGRSGGYSLGRRTAEISLLDVIEALEGKFEYKKSKRSTVVNEALSLAMEKTSEALKSLTLEQLIEEKRKKDRTFVYSI
ncbi:MAG TPA: Rrf2 family transcriptional regulator [Candidatus Omnitrophota bacterium]|nr:Rrf2 family transcriptional regulator [Candidatus Omnitrophota bacterium]